MCFWVIVPSWQVSFRGGEATNLYKEKGLEKREVWITGSEQELLVIYVVWKDIFYEKGRATTWHSLCSVCLLYYVICNYTAAFNSGFILKSLFGNEIGKVIKYQLLEFEFLR